MTQEYNIYYRKPQLGEDCFLISLDDVGGYSHLKWTDTEDRFYSSDIIIFKDWQSAKAAADFILNYINNNPERFGFLKHANYEDEIYFLKLGYLDSFPWSTTLYKLEFLPNPDYLLERGLIYPSPEAVEATRLILEEALYKEVRNKNLTGISSNFKLGKLVYTPNIYTNSVEIDTFDPLKHRGFVERSLMFSTEEVAQEMLQALSKVPDLVFKSRFAQN